MFAFDPDKIDVEITHEEIVTENGQTSMQSNWEMSIPEQGGTAWYRLTPEMREFLILVYKKNGVVGFDYDFEEGGFNFGVIVKKDKNE
jgi:hypothetical protein